MWVDQLAYYNNKKYPLQTHVHTNFEHHHKKATQIFNAIYYIITKDIYCIYNFSLSSRGQWKRRKGSTKINQVCVGVYRFIQYNTECYNTLVAKTSSDILARGHGQGWGGRRQARWKLYFWTARWSADSWQSAHPVANLRDPLFG